MNKEIISVVVLSYNSERTIYETLNSILEQDYGSNYIELIIGDDASTDKTRSMIQDWANLYEIEFHRVILNLNVNNLGVANNFNSICKLATSTWIKPIAADDILTNNCITEFNSFVSNEEFSCVFCKVEKFNQKGYLGTTPSNSYFFTIPAEKQFENLLIDNFLTAPGCFLKKQLLEHIGYAEETLAMEDYYLWLKITQLGIQIPLLDKVLVKYRISNSLSNSDQRIINIKLNKDVYYCKIKFKKKLKSNIFIKMLISIDIKLFFITDLLKIYVFKNKKSRLSKFISPLPRMLSPYYLLRKTKTKTKKPYE
ncbi:glycosyltransferase [Providencia sp. wls1919]|nr:glycosyltransferase [Providencia sp. wls1919]